MFKIDFEVEKLRNYQKYETSINNLNFSSFRNNETFLAFLSLNYCWEWDFLLVLVKREMNNEPKCPKLDIYLLCTKKKEN